MHLQDSYFAEMNTVGTSATAIGYNAPASNVFGYAISETSGSAQWAATSNQKLNDCNANSAWTVTSANASGAVSHTAAAPDADGVCAALTPSFTQIGAASHN